MITKVRAFADPTWTPDDLPPGVGLKDRLSARVNRAYGWLARKRGEDQVRRKLQI